MIQTLSCLVVQPLTKKALFHLVVLCRNKPCLQSLEQEIGETCFLSDFLGYSHISGTVSANVLVTSDKALSVMRFNQVEEFRRDFEWWLYQNTG